MSKDAHKLRQQFHTRMLEIEQKTGSFPIDTRFYQGLIRIATAYAKHYLSDVVTVEHMQMAIDLQKRALLSFRMEVEKGQINMDLQQKATSKDGAFDHCFREVQGKFQQEFVSDEDVVKDMLERYPDKWKSESEAYKYFNDMWEIKKIVKTGKLYKMAGR